MNSMIRSTVAAGKGQLLKASTRAVPLGSVADHSPAHEGTSLAIAKEVCEAKGHKCHWPHSDLKSQDGHVVLHHSKNMYELVFVKKPKGEKNTLWIINYVL